MDFIVQFVPGTETEVERRAQNEELQRVNSKRPGQHFANIEAYYIDLLKNKLEDMVKEYESGADVMKQFYEFWIVATLEQKSALREALKNIRG